MGRIGDSDQRAAKLSSAESAVVELQGVGGGLEPAVPPNSLQRVRPHSEVDVDRVR